MMNQDHELKSSIVDSVQKINQNLTINKIEE